MLLIIFMVYFSGFVTSLTILISSEVRNNGYITIKDFVGSALMSLLSWIIVAIFVFMIIHNHIFNGDFGQKVMFGKRK